MEDSGPVKKVGKSNSGNQKLDYFKLRTIE